MNTFKKRIDELGRIVIPKEIRKLYKINSFDELELTTENNSIVITKSIGIKESKYKIKKLLILLNNICNFNIIILQNNEIIESTYNDIKGKLNIYSDETIRNVNMSLKTDNIEITGYMYLDKIIVDSNVLGDILFIKKDPFEDIKLLTNIKNLLIQLIN